MFERNKIDNVEHNGVPVEITTEAGDVMTGRLLVPVGRGLGEVLNGAGGFIEFEPWGGERIYVLKVALRRIRLAEPPRAESLRARLTATDTFDPHSLLGVKANASHDEIKAAWHRLSKAYHPDRYAAAELPDEVIEYLQAMARRINAAYAALEAPLMAERRAAATRSAPVYTSRPRA